MRHFTLVSTYGKALLPAPVPAVYARVLYQNGVRLSLEGNCYIQVWETNQHGEQLRYDDERTRKLTDKIVAARVARGEDANPGMQVKQ